MDQRRKYLFYPEYQHDWSIKPQTLDAKPKHSETTTVTAQLLKYQLQRLYFINKVGVTGPPVLKKAPQSLLDETCSKKSAHWFMSLF